MLVTIDIQKAFDSINQLSTFNLKEIWIQQNVLLHNQTSYIIKGGFTTKYFKLDKGACQGDPISAYLFILVLEAVFNLIKQNKVIHNLKFFNHTFLYTAYADDIPSF